MAMLKLLVVLAIVLIYLLIRVIWIGYDEMEVIERKELEE